MRPFRNPQNQAEVDANHLWKIVQYGLPTVARDEDWQWTAAWQQDEHGYAAGVLDYPHPPDHFADAENALHRERRPREDMATNVKMMKMYKRLDLEKLKDGPRIARDISLPPFKVAYDSHEQIHQKLRDTVILIKDNPYYVTQTCEYEAGKFALLVSDNEGTASIVHYDDIVDVRGVAPGYFQYRGDACWVYRIPERQNSQGMSQRNTRYKPCGGGETGARWDMLLNALSQAKDIQYAPNLDDLLTGGVNRSLRLNHRVALYLTKKKGAPIGVEYCGRPLGLVVNGHCKAMDETDLIPSWIHKDLAKVNLRLVA